MAPLNIVEWTNLKSIFLKVDAGVCYVHLCIHQDYECGGGRIKLEKMLVNLDEDYPLEYFD